MCMWWPVKASSGLWRRRPSCCHQEQWVSSAVIRHSSSSRQKANETETLSWSEQLACELDEKWNSSIKRCDGSNTDHISYCLSQCNDLMSHRCTGSVILLKKWRYNVIWLFSSAAHSHNPRSLFSTWQHNMMWSEKHAKSVWNITLKNTKEPNISIKTQTIKKTKNPYCRKTTCWCSSYVISTSYKVAVKRQLILSLKTWCSSLLVLFDTQLQPHSGGCHYYSSHKHTHTHKSWL